MANVSVSPNTVKAPSPKPRNLSVTKLTASFEQQSSDKPQPLPRSRKSDRSLLEEKQVIPDYVNETEMDKIRSGDLTAQSTSHSAPTLSAAQHILQTSRLGSEGDGGSSDEEGRQYINCPPQGLVQQQRRLGQPAEAVVSDDQLPRRPAGQVHVETTGESKVMEAYMNCNPGPVSPRNDDETDSYVEMNPTMSRRLVIQRDIAADSAYVKMNSAPRQLSQGAVQQTVYQVPKSNRPVCSPVDPKAVAGIYEIEPDANPLHPHHQSHVLQQLHNDDPLHSSLRRGSVPARPLSATIHKYSRVPKTPPPKTRPPDCPPPTDSSFSSRKMRSYSTDELNISPLQASASPLAFNPPLKQQNRKSGSPHLMGNIVGFHGRMARKLAETRLVSSSHIMIGDYIIRESTNTPPGKMQCVISLRTTSAPMHVIVDYRDGMFWMSASENNQVSFVTMEDLLLHYKENPIVVDSKGNKVKLLNPIPLRRTSD